MNEDRKLYWTPLLSVTQIARQAVYQISFARKMDFLPGQVVALTSDLKIPARLYSIVSGINEAEIRVLFDVIPAGVLTKQLAKLKKGGVIYVSKPFGEFICDNSPAYWIASGTGIAPFASMFYSGLRENKILIHGGKTLESFYFEEDFAPLFGEKYIRCCSREKGGGVYEGRVTDYLRQCRDLPSDYKYYLCGSTEMVVETRDILISKDVPFDKISAEIYF